MKVRRQDDAHVWEITDHITMFVNNAFGRRLRRSRALYDAILDALLSGYSEDELRVAFWTARTLTGNDGQTWLCDALSRDLPPEIVLRFRGALNTRTGATAKRHLDELLSRVDETNPMLVSRVLEKLPEDMRAGEQELLGRMNVPIK
jgi:hypothetical protein